jgi:hypothetical protein
MQHSLSQTKNGVRQSVGQLATEGLSVMGARIIELAAYRTQRLESQARAAQELKPVAGNRFHFWTGASGKRYVHTIYDLIDCPTLPPANYVLVRREAGARRQILSIGRVRNASPSLNLAEIRQRGAELGAHEVHVHLLAESAKLSRMVEFDLKTGQVEKAFANMAGRSVK